MTFEFHLNILKEHFAGSAFSLGPVQLIIPAQITIIIEIINL